MIKDFEKIIADECPAIGLSLTDASSLMMFKCVRRKFAKSFIEGKIYFGTPREWIGLENSGNKGQGDKLEGVICSVKTEDAGDLIKDLGKDTTIECFTDKGYTFFRRKEALDYRCFCLYGVDDTCFQKVVDQDGRSRYRTSVSKEYFSDFSEHMTKEEYSKVESEEQPVVIFIKNPRSFLERICSSLKKLGVKDEEMIISPVEYINWYSSYELKEATPRELLYKDKFFSRQREYRIIVNNKSDKFLDYLQNNTTLDIGPIDDISEIHDFYFDDMSLELVGSNGLLYSLSEPEKRDIEHLDFWEWNILLNNVLQGYVTLTGSKGKDLGWEEQAQLIINKIESKFRVHVTVDKSRKINLTIFDPDLNKQFEEKYLKNPYIGFELDMQKLLDNGLSDEVIDNCIRASENFKKKGICDYYIAKALFNKGRASEAISSYLYSYKKGYKQIESMDGIAAILVFQEKYAKAISVYQAIQEEKGYDPKIYGNIGNCLIGLGKYDEAVETIDKGLAIDNNDAWLYYTKGMALYYSKEYDRSRECLKKAAMIEPNNMKYCNELIKYFSES